MCFNGEESAIPVPAVAYGDKDNAAEQAEKLFGALREADRTDAGLFLYAARGQKASAWLSSTAC